MRAGVQSIVAENGKLSQSELSPIPGGQLEHEAAAAWNAPHGPADNGLRPAGAASSYRLYGPITQYGTQQYFYAHQPPLAAWPGTSNHGWGKAVDLAETWMRAWIDEHGAEFGWRKTEAFSEWWHVNYDGSKHFPVFETLERGDHGKRVVKFTRRLAYIHPKGSRNGYVGSWRFRFDKKVEDGVRDFQRDHDLKQDGVIGPKTARRINALFHKQWHRRHRRLARLKHRGEPRK